MPVSPSSSVPTSSPGRLLRSVAISVAVLVLLGCPPEPDPPDPPPEPKTQLELDVGLTEAERVAWRSLSEGSDLFPVAILRALRDVHTGELFIDSMENYGFLPRPASAANPYGLPVGWSVNVPEFSLLNLDYVGINCSACHTGQIDYQDTAMRFDGGSNMADIEAWGLALKDSGVALLENPVEGLLFLWRLIRLEPPEQDGSHAFADSLPEDSRAFLERYGEALSNDVDEPEDALARHLGESLMRVFAGHSAADTEVSDLDADGFASVDGAGGPIRDLLHFFEKYAALLKNRIELGVLAINALESSPVPGPGRDDPWGLIRNLLFLTPTELTAPTNIPHLYSASEYGWYHADGNTNSVMQRDIAQAVALGAFVDEKTRQSTLLPRQIWELEAMLAKLRSPAWPEGVLGSIDREKAELGKEIFHRKMTVPGAAPSSDGAPAPSEDGGISGMAGASVACADCHAAWQGKLFTLEAVGTDPNRAKNFLRPQGDQPFWVAIPQAVGEIEKVAYELAGITPEEAREHEYHYPPEWRGTGRYIARRLDGIWSTAPYLHNGSVPTLYDLLKPPAERPTTFPLGQREYDPTKVGYTTTVENPIFVFDTTKNGSSNSGHVYGTDLSDEERWALVEYLKTL